MSFVYPPPAFKACDRCGACVLRTELDTHACDPERRLDFELVRLQPGVVAFFKADWPGWLESTAGLFEQMYAERSRP